MNATLIAPPKHHTMIAAAWGVMLCASILPEVVTIELLHIPQQLAWITWGRLVALAGFTAVCWLWQPIRPLWKYAIILLIFAAGQELMTWMGKTAVWQNGVNTIQTPFVRDYLGVQFKKLGATTIVLIGLFVLGFRRKDVFLVRGQLDAPITPVWWLGFPRPESWVSFGLKWIIFLSIGMVILLALFGTIHLQSLATALGLMPSILLISALNAFNEEVTYRSAQLGSLEPAVGTQQAWWITAVLFAIMHYYSAVNRVAGVLLTVFMGWMLAKAMLETRGFFWPWLIHSTQDVIILWFIAGGSSRLS